MASWPFSPVQNKQKQQQRPSDYWTATRLLSGCNNVPKNPQLTGECCNPGFQGLVLQVIRVVRVVSGLLLGAAAGPAVGDRYLHHHLDRAQVVMGGSSGSCWCCCPVQKGSVRHKRRVITV